MFFLIDVTIESLLEELNVNINLISNLGRVFNQFGMYKSGGGSFDRSIYNTVDNGEEELSHETKKCKSLDTAF